MKTLGMAFVGLEAIDAFLTMWAVNTQGCVEANPLLAPIAGSWLSPTVKVLPALFAVWALTKVAARWPRTRLVVNSGLCLTVAFMAAVLLSNLSEL